VSDDLAAILTEFKWDPLGYARMAWDWGNGELEKFSGPREWQANGLRIIGEHLQNPETRHQPLRFAIASGHDIGKSAWISMIIQWGMSTFEDCRVVVTANTDSQLRTKTWPEVKKWFRLAINSDWFTCTATGVFANDKQRTDWRSDALPWSENNSEAFAGLHNLGKRIIVIMDEASAIPQIIWDVIDGALMDEGTEIIFIALGNPTQANGAFRECFRKNAKRWKHIQIDSRTVEGVNKEELDRMIEDHGIDSDFCKTRILGVFPSASAKQYISESDIDAAFGRHLKPDQYQFAPKIITVDPAWTGDDDLVIAMRQGLYFQILHTMPYNDNDIWVGNLLARLEDEHHADAVFIDGGFGTGIASVGTTLRRNWSLVWFGEKAIDDGCMNKRAEMIKGARDWIKAGGALPPNERLREDLRGYETLPRMDGKLQFVSKEEMKKRGFPSPNLGDALALSFAYPVASRQTGANGFPKPKTVLEYDMFEEGRV
jgi:hypothetical protein